MKRLITLALLTGMLFTLAACGSKPQSTPTPNHSTGTTSSTEEYQYPEMTIKLAHDTSSATPVHESSERIKEEIERVSGGRIKVDIYPQQQLGSAREMIEGMQMNSIELVLLPTSKYGGFDQTLNMLDLP